MRRLTIKPGQALMDGYRPSSHSEVKDCLSWFTNMLVTPKKERGEWLKSVIKSIKNTFNSKARAGETEELVKLLESSDVEIIGFTPNIQYLRVSGSEEMLKPWWVHPFQSPTLVVKHKRLPLILLVGPSLRLNESTIKGISDNGVEEEPLIGFTG